MFIFLLIPQKYCIYPKLGTGVSGRVSWQINYDAEEFQRPLIIYYIAYTLLEPIRDLIQKKKRPVSVINFILMNSMKLKIRY